MWEGALASKWCSKTAADPHSTAHRQDISVIVRLLLGRDRQTGQREEEGKGQGGGDTQRQEEGRVRGLSHGENHHVPLPL